MVQAVADAARRAASAEACRVVAIVGQELRVVAVAGGETSWIVGASVAADDEGVGYTLASAQAHSVAGTEAAGGRPTLCVPCVFDGEPLGAVELVARPGQEAFGMPATELATLFAGVAAVALAAREGTSSGVPTAREIASELARLEATDPSRYASLARAVSALLA